MKYKTPNIVMEIPAIENVTMSDVVQYLNEVVEYYGPPCEYCRHFDDVICEKAYRPRLYMLEIGPFEEWHIRRFCEYIEFEEGVENEIERIKKKVKHALDCFIQKYG